MPISFEKNTLYSRFFNEDVYRCFLLFKDVTVSNYLSSSNLMFEILSSDFLIARFMNVFMRHGKKYFVFSSFLKSIRYLQQHGFLFPIWKLSNLLSRIELMYDFKWVYPFSKKKRPFWISRILNGRSRWLISLRFLKREYVKMDYSLHKLFLFHKKSIFRCYYIRLAYFFFKLLKMIPGIVAVFNKKRVNSLFRKRRHIMYFNNLLAIRNRNRAFRKGGKNIKWNWTRGFGWRKKIIIAKKKLSSKSTRVFPPVSGRRARKILGANKYVKRHLKKRVLKRIK